MAWANLGASGTAASSTSSSTLNFTLPAAIDVGNVGLLRVVSDNISTADGNTNDHTSVSGWTGTITKLGERTNTVGGAAGDGVCVSLWLLEASAIIAVNTVLTINFSASVADKSAAFQRFSKGAGTTARAIGAVATGGADASNNPGALALAGLDSSSRLYVRAVGVEGNSSTSLTASTGFTALASVRSRNNASAVYAAGEFRVNASAGETSAPTLPTTSDNASVFAAIQEYAAAALPLSFTGDTLPAEVHAYQAGPATRLNGSGVVVSAAGARFDYLLNGVYSAVTSALLVEPAATNFVVRSAEFDNANWQKIGSTISANAVAAPDGTTAMDKIVEDATTGRHMAVGFPGVSGGKYYGSAFLKAAERNYAFVGMRDTGSGAGAWGFAAIIDLSSGTVVSTNNYGTPTGTGYRVESYGGGIYRLIVWMDRAGSNELAVGPVNSSSPSWLQYCPTYTGDGTSGVYAWGAMASDQDVTYIPTTSTSVTRPADNVQFLIPGGVSALILSYDDNSTETVSVTPDTNYTIPTNLNRVRIKSIDVPSIPVAISEMASGGDSVSAAVTIPAAASEAGSAGDAGVATMAVTASASELASAGDAPAGTMAASAAITEASGAGDSMGGALAVTVAASDAGLAGDAPAASVAITAAASEAVNASDTPGAGAAMAGAVNEGGSAADSPAAAMAAGASASEAGNAGDAATSALTVVVATSEAAGGGDLSEAVAAMTAVIIEASASDDSVSSNAVAFATIAEAADAGDHSGSLTEALAALIEAAAGGDLADALVVIVWIPTRQRVIVLPGRERRFALAPRARRFALAPRTRRFSLPPRPRRFTLSKDLAVKTITQDVVEGLDYTFDCPPGLLDTGDPIVEAAAEVTSGDLVIGGVAHDADSFSIWIESGSKGFHEVLVTFTTEGNRRFAQRLRVRLTD